MGPELGRVRRGPVGLGAQVVLDNMGTVLQKSAERPGIDM